MSDEETLKTLIQKFRTNEFPYCQNITAHIFTNQYLFRLVLDHHGPSKRAAILEAANLFYQNNKEDLDLLNKIMCKRGPEWWDKFFKIISRPSKD